MIVCVCHGIRCREVRESAGEGLCRASDVFKRFGAKPRCGICVSTIKEMLNASAAPVDLDLASGSNGGGTNVHLEKSAAGNLGQSAGALGSEAADQ